MKGLDGRKLSRIISLVLIVGTIAIYGQTIRFDFIDYDDPSYVVNNSFVNGGLTSEGLSWAFTARFIGNWHPLTWISHMADCELFGLAAGGHHLMSVLLHICNSLLLFGVLRQFTGAIWRSAIVAGLFAWHPLHVESVAWVSERKDVLCAFFGFLTLAAWTHYAQTGVRRFYWFALVCFALGLMSKTMLVTLPFLLLLLDYWPLRRTVSPDHAPLEVRVAAWRKLILEKIPFVAMSAAASVLIFWAQRSGGAIAPLSQLSVSARLANASVAYCRYLLKTIWPSDLAAFYPMPESWPMAEVAASVLVLAAISAVAVIWRRKRPWLLTGWCWFLGTMVPVIGLVQIGKQSMADRYTYIPLVGIFIMVVWGLGEIAERRPATRRPLAAAATAALAACMVVTFFQARTWRNGMTLFTHALLVTRNNSLAHDQVGLAYYKMGRLDDAMAEFDEALKIEPDSRFVIYHQGMVLARQDKVHSAMGYYYAEMDRRGLSYSTNSPPR